MNSKCLILNQRITTSTTASGLHQGLLTFAFYKHRNLTTFGLTLFFVCLRLPVFWQTSSRGSTNSRCSINFTKNSRAKYEFWKQFRRVLVGWISYDHDKLCSASDSCTVQHLVLRNVVVVRPIVGFAWRGLRESMDVVRSELLLLRFIINEYL